MSTTLMMMVLALAFVLVCLITAFAMLYHHVKVTRPWVTDIKVESGFSSMSIDSSKVVIGGVSNRKEESFLWFAKSQFFNPLYDEESVIGTLQFQPKITSTVGNHGVIHI